MNDDKSLFAEMLGMKNPYAAEPEEDAAEIQADAAEASDGEPAEPADGEAREMETDDSAAFDELDVQKEVVSEMARDKAEFEEKIHALEEEKAALVAANAAFEAERKAMSAKVAAAESERRDLESRISSYEEEIAELRLDIKEVRRLNQELERKLARMGKTVFAVKRAAAEAARVEIGGRRW